MDTFVLQMQNPVIPFFLWNSVGPLWNPVVPFFPKVCHLCSDLPLVLFFLLLLQFIMLTYIFMLAWLGVTAFTSLPVYMYFNLWTICRNATVVDGANLCLDLRQYGT